MATSEGQTRFRVTLRGVDPETRELCERICASCWEAGAGGVEEHEESGAISLSIYCVASSSSRVYEAAIRIVDGEGDVTVPETIEEVDWSESWKTGLEAIEVSPRLVVRPSFAVFEKAAGQVEVVIDPKQAFGTGGHASTLLALEWIDALTLESGPAGRLLDVGTGTGVLALAALQLGAGSAVAFDLDPIAAIEAREWAGTNAVAERLHAFAGGIEALSASTAGFDWVVANLLRREMLPLVPAIVQALAPQGSLVLSGLLVDDRPEVEAAYSAFGIETVDARFATDPGGGDRWIALLMRQNPAAGN